MKTKQELGPKQQAWVNALRSGKYLQGQRRLRQETPVEDVFEYCCLGVMCDLFSDATWENKVPEAILFYPPSHVKHAYKLTDGGMGALSRMNDVERFDFEKIAALVCEYPHRYFAEPA